MKHEKIKSFYDDEIVFLAQWFRSVGTVTV